jgi:hypothetical protein
MTKRDLFIVLIKIFGLLTIVVTLFSSVTTYLIWSLESLTVKYFLWILITVGVIAGLLILLIFNANRLALWLRLDRGFDDERIDFGNLSPTDIVRIGVFFIGGVMFVKNISPFLSNLFLAFSADVEGFSGGVMGRNQYVQWGVSALNLIIGYLMLTRFVTIASWFDAKAKEDEPSANES